MKRMMMLGLVSLSACVGVVAAQDTVNHELREFTRWNEGSPYSGRCVVRVRTTSQHQLDGVLRIANDVWSERTGQGPLDIEIDRDSLGGLDAIGVPYDVLIDDLQAHADEHARDMLDLRMAQRTAKPDGFQRGGQVHDEDWFETYRTLDEITSYISNIESLRPDLAEVETIGQSLLGRDMFSITISGPSTDQNPREDRPAVFIFSTVHAREWIAPMTTSYIASRLVADYDTDLYVRMLLDNARVVIVPVGNPDGYAYSWSEQRFWRKTRRDNGDGTFGVDINRNWSFQWGGEGASQSTASNTYHGPAPFSEPETRALRDVGLALGDKLVAQIDYHSYSQLILWPYGYAASLVTASPWADSLEHIATCVADEIHATSGEQYTPQQSTGLYPASGTSKDWFYGVFARPAYTLELRTLNSFNPPSSEIRPCANENYEGFKVYIEKTALTQQILHEPVAHRDAFDQGAVRVFAFTDTGTLGVDDLKLHARVGTAGDYSAYAMAETDRRTYEASLPQPPCGGIVQYYFSLALPDGAIRTFPEQGMNAPYESVFSQRAYTYRDALETDAGWVVGLPEDNATSGIWELATPVRTTHQPGSDQSIDGTRCWVTDARVGGDANEHDVDGGETSIVSPRFSALEGSVLSFWFWQNPSIQRRDAVRVGFSNDDGLSWVYPAFLRSGDPGNWVRMSYDLDDYLEPGNSMRLRFSIRDVREDSTVELAIDDIAVGVPGCPANAADINADGQLNIFDITLFIEFFNAQSVSADYNGDSEINFFDVAEYLRIFTGQ
ncbi:MAG: M14 family zinc carboxypeptidase [Phycisphaerales bacterium]